MVACSASYHNYSALRDRLQKRDIHVSVTTIIKRAKQLECYQPQKPRKVHDLNRLPGTFAYLTPRQWVA